MKNGIAGKTGPSARGAGRRRLARGLAVCLAVLAAAGGRAGEPWKFLVYGDSRGPDVEDPVNTVVLEEIAARTVLENPAFVLFTGDLTIQGAPSQYAIWTNAMRAVYAAGIPVYPIMGNHELIPQTFTNWFGAVIPDNGPPEELNRTFALVHNNALFLNLDSRGNRVNQPWIDGILATNRSPHVFVLSHVPAFKLRHTDCLGAFPAERDVFWASLVRAGVRAYFCGHDHFYEHARIDDGDGEERNDIHSFTAGTAGAPLYADNLYDGDNGPYTPVRIHHEQSFGYLVVRVDGVNLAVEWVRRVSPGVYAGGDDDWVGATRLPPPRIELQSVEDGSLLFVLHDLVPHALTTLEHLEGERWVTLMSTNAVATTLVHREPAGRIEGTYRLRME